MAIGLTYDNFEDWDWQYAGGGYDAGTVTSHDGYMTGEFGDVTTTAKAKKPKQVEPTPKKQNNTWIIVLVVVIGLAAGALIIKKLF